ncbi:MAG TPA: ATP-binding protein [Planctomycetota bacterium]|nr:ATP-binding protein [Planctomycetota bacterium]
MIENRIAGLDARASRLEQIRAETRKLSGRLYELSLLNELWEAAHRVQSVHELLDCVLDTCMSMLRAESGSVFLYDKQSDELVLSSARGRMAESLHDVRQKLGEGVAGYVATAVQPLFVPDIRLDPRFTPRDTARYQSGSFVSVPLVFDNELLGVISLHDKQDGKAFEPQDLKQLLVAANYSSTALKKLSRHELLEEFNKELHSRLDTALEKLSDTNSELARLKSYNENIVKSIPLGLITFNQSFEITFCNDRFVQLYGAAPGSKSLLELDITDRGRSWAKELRAVIALGDVVRFDSAAFVPPSQDKSYMVRAVATALKDVDGVIIGGVVVVEDITQRVKMERMLAAAERHAVIGKLAARVAHELNNPLDGIMRFVNLAMAISKDDAKMQMYLGETKKGLERMAGIVGSLLEFSRNTHRPRRNVHINDAIQESISSIKFKAEELHVQIKTDLAADLPELGCDMTQVLLNLTKNALDAMPRGGTLSVTSALSDGSIVVTVADTGTGMPEGIRKRVFDPFFTTKDPGKGTGLGLAICHDIVEKHQGTITVESEEGKGTVFTIKLPVPPAGGGMG